MSFLFNFNVEKELVAEEKYYKLVQQNFDQNI